jgi:hypothetical protein
MKTQLFAICSLLAMAGAMDAQVQIPTNLDHFNCYLAPGPIQPATALLHDQFDIAPPSATFLPGFFETVTDLRSVLFCNPVQKTLVTGATTQILHADAHLMMYLINPQASTPRKVTVVNQFGTTTLQTGRALILAVPSGKALLTPAGAAPALPAIPAQTELDHFKCYEAAGETATVPVTLTDQFRTEKVQVLRPILFCNPTLKEVLNGDNAIAAVPTVTPVTYPLSHLTCYLTTPVPFQGVVVYNNQFVIPGTFPTLTLSQSEILCVPSAKSSWSVIPPPAQISSGPPNGN